MFFTGLQSSENTNFDNCNFKLLFILDGLDESQLKMDTTINEIQDTNVDVMALCSVDVLLTKID